MPTTRDDLDWKVWGNKKNNSSQTKSSAPIGAYDPDSKTTPEKKNGKSSSQDEAEHVKLQ